MKVNVIGARESHGTSKKTGNPYDITFVSVVYPDTAVGARGQTCETLLLPADTYPAGSIVLDAYYNVEYNNRGRVIAFEQCADR